MDEKKDPQLTEEPQEFSLGRRCAAFQAVFDCLLKRSQEEKKSGREKLLLVEAGEGKNEDVFELFSSPIPATVVVTGKENTLKTLKELKEAPDLLFLNLDSQENLKLFFTLKNQFPLGTVIACEAKEAKGLSQTMDRAGVKTLELKKGEKKESQDTLNDPLSYKICAWVLEKPMRPVFNLVARNNEYGLTHDGEIVKSFFPGVHFTHKAETSFDEFDYADVNIFIEHVLPQMLPRAKANVLIPNVEYYFEHLMSYLPLFNRILYKTKWSTSLYQGKSCVVTGWESPDRYTPVPVRDYHSFIHIAGLSPAKQTGVVLSTWRKYPDLPGIVIVYGDSKAAKIDLSDLPKNVTFIEERLSDEEIRRLMSTYALHLCPSKNEGFGHYINEARSCEAVVVTTDGPPMNELITPEYGFLVSPSVRGKYFRVESYEITPEDLYPVIKRVMKLTVEEKKALGRKARERFLSERDQFRTNMRNFREQLFTELGDCIPDPAFNLENVKFEEVKKLREVSRHQEAYAVLKTFDLEKARSDFIRNFGYYDEMSIVAFYVGKHSEGFEAYEKVWRLNAVTPAGREILKTHLWRMKVNSGAYQISKFSEDTKRFIRDLRVEFGPELDGITKRL